MTTNGAKMSVQLFRRLAQSGISGFNFSLNAASEAIYQNVMQLKGLGTITTMIDQLIKIRNTEFPWVAVHVSFVVCDQNRHEVHHFVEQWRNRGIRQVWLHPLNNRAGLVSDSARSTDMYFD